MIYIIVDLQMLSCLSELLRSLMEVILTGSSHGISSKAR